MPDHTTTVAVVGSGPTGLAAALALGRTLGPASRPLGAETRLFAAAAALTAAAADRRTAALFSGSIEFLKNLGAWDDIAAASQPITAIRLIDDTGGLLKAPEVLFPASEIGLCELGWNVPHRVLIEALVAALRRPDSGVTIVETAGISRLDHDETGITLHTCEGSSTHAQLVAGADGRQSLCRVNASIRTQTWSYPQAALATSFSHNRPHFGISTEFHRASGPFTTVPLPGSASSLVWVEKPEEASRLMGLDDDAFRAALETRLQGLLGNVGAIAPRAMFPLAGLTAERFGQNRVALIGEAGHVIPPIGAQGLNLGLRDGAVLADCVAEAISAGRDPGAPDVLLAYDAQRRTDVATRVLTIDLLNRSLLSTLLPVHLARGAGLVALKAFAPLRRAIVREGLSPSAATPILMQPGGDALFANRLESFRLKSQHKVPPHPKLAPLTSASPRYGGATLRMDGER